MLGCHTFCFLTILSTNKIRTAHKYLIEYHNELSYFILPLYTHPKISESKENYEVFSRTLGFHLVDDETITTPKAPKSHVKLITYLNIDKGFDLLIALVFYISPQLGVLGPKSQDHVISLFFGEGETFPQFHLRYLQTENCFLIERLNSTHK